MPESDLHGMAVVIVNNFPGPGMGGAEVHLLPVVAALAGRGVAVTVVAPAGSEFAHRATLLGAGTHPDPLSPRAVAAAIGAIRGAVAGHRGVVRPVLMGTGYFTNLLVRLAAPGTGAAVVNMVAVVPGASRWDGGSTAGVRVRALADRATRGRVDRFIAVSRAVADALVARGAAAQRVSVIMNGIDFCELESGAGGHVHGVEPGDRVVACVARLQRVKGVEYFVRAAGLVEGAVFVIAGSGPLEARLREIAAAQRGGSKVLFLGAVPSAAALMSRAQVVAVPSLSEAFGLVAAEAMALGRPVVASNVGGLPEVVEDGVAGLLVPPADPEHLARGIRHLLEDPETARRMGEAGAVRARSLFDANRMAREYVAVLEELAHG